MSNKVIGVKQVLECLDKGMSREEIAEHFGINMTDCKRLFMDARLKGKKAKKQPAFTLVEDSENVPHSPTPPGISDDEVTQPETIEVTDEEVVETETQEEDTTEENKEEVTSEWS